MKLCGGHSITPCILPLVNGWVDCQKIVKDSTTTTTATTTHHHHYRRHDFEENPLAVEIYDLQSHTWIKSNPMPRIFNHPASPIWLHFQFVPYGVEMPVDFVEDLKRCETVISSIDVIMAGNVVYICVDSRGEEVVVCAVGDGGGCRWRTMVNTVVDMDKVVLTCSVVGLEEVIGERRRFRPEKIVDWYIGGGLG
ncbi:hypothetical protein Hanom_Chr15g01357791 [Helianthus anomalus]